MSASNDNANSPQSILMAPPTPIFPIHIFRSLADPLTTLADRVSANVDYLVGTLLVLAAGLIGNTREVQIHSGWTEPCALWVLLVGTASNAKSPSMRAVMSHLEDLYRTEEEAYLAALARFQAGETAEEPRRHRLVPSDISNVMLVQEGGHNRRGQIVISKEGAPFLIGANDKFLEAFNGESVTYARATTGTVHSDRLLASCAGAVHPHDIEKQIANRAGDGGLARCLVMEPERRPFALPANVETCPDLAPVFRRLHGIPLGDKPLPLSLEETAVTTFEGWVREHEQEEYGGAIDLHFAKLRGIAPRLALVVDHIWAASENRPMPEMVSHLAMLGAIAMIEEYWKPMALKVYRVGWTPGVSPQTRALARWILVGRHTRINKRDIYKHARLPGLSKPEAVQEALDDLTDFGWVRRAPARAGAGRRPEDYSVIPAIYDLPEAM
ncbi:MAG: hypothetical protein VR70_12255 [Rhodospirillaceae bacterium BRH_c57]|nr:MAG: hypothetical protein VR70_12255 [Rhodospirillaceae bacterium BRH_c57]